MQRLTFVCDVQKLTEIADELDEEYQALQGMLCTGSDVVYSMGLCGTLERAERDHNFATRIRQACKGHEDET